MLDLAPDLVNVIAVARLLGAAGDRAETSKLPTPGRMVIYTSYRPPTDGLMGAQPYADEDTLYWCWW